MVPTSGMLSLQSLVKSELLRLSPGSGRQSFPLSEGTREMGVIIEPNLGSDLCNRQIPRPQVILCSAQTLVQKIPIWRSASSGFEQPSEVEWAQPHNRCDLRQMEVLVQVIRDEFESGLN